MMGVMEVIKFLVVDLIIFLVLCIAAYIGYQRSYRISLINVLIQLFSIFTSGLMAGVLLEKALSYIPEKVKISLLVPDSFYYLVEPYEDLIIPCVVFSILFIILFVIIKSTLSVFSINYEWYRYLFPLVKFNRIGDGVLSMFLTILNTYTYILIFLIILAFPLLDLVKPYSLTNVLLNVNPYVSHLVDKLYEPYEGLKKGIDLFGEDLEPIFRADKVDLNKLEQFMNNHPSQRKEIQSAFEEFLPFIATTSGFLSFFPDNKIDKDEMITYLNTMQTYIDKDVLTLEIFNSYYKELIHNETYGRLIEDEVISNEALKTLINSGMLNDVNLKKIKEYVTLD